MTVIFGPPNAVRLERCPVTEIFYKLGLQPSRRSVHQSKHRRRTAVPFVEIQQNTRTVNELAHLPLTQQSAAKVPFRREPDFSCDWPSECARVRDDNFVCSEGPA